MKREEAIRLIIIDYCNSHGITPTEFARNSGISKSYMSKINKKQWGKTGISMTYCALLAAGMNMDEIQFQTLIKKYQNKGIETKFDDEDEKNTIINSIGKELDKYETKDLKLIDKILKKSDSKAIERLYDIYNSIK
ncbi:MAG: helix-turn-helix transcriptional regulator [Bacilli bacterium]|nr:helix-turn-helix transcriptional regulator [Bacilli bacterium]